MDKIKPDTKHVCSDLFEQWGIVPITGRGKDGRQYTIRVLSHEQMRQCAQLEFQEKVRSILKQRNEQSSSHNPSPLFSER